MLELILLIVGFIMIIKASDVLVDAASSLAIKFKVPKMLIALTIVAFGTCAPEVAISFNSVIDKNGAFDISKCNLIAYANGGYYSLGKKLGTFGYSVSKKKQEEKV